MRNLVLLSVFVSSLVLSGCGSGGGEPPVPPAPKGSSKTATAKAGATNAKGLSPENLMVPSGSTANFGSKVPGGK